MGNVRMRAEMIDYGATNVKKALDDLDVSDLLKLNARMNKIDAWVDTVEETELTGNPVEFQNALAVSAKSLVTTINAIQDLHGYDHPWAGGAGKNKLPSQTVIVYGQDNKYFKLSEDATLSAGTYTASFYNDSNSQSKIIINEIIDGAEVTIGSATINAKSRGSYTFTLTDSFTIRIGGRFEPATTITDSSVFKEFQIESGNTATSFAPYSNECPISGRTEVVITRSDGDEISEDFTIQLGQTVYGAEINWDTGVGTVTHGFATFNGGESENWVLGGESHKYFRYPDIDAKATEQTSIANIISNEFESVTFTDTYNGVAGVSVNNNGKIYVYVDDTISTVELFKTWLSTHNLQICYELATPTTIQLTPEQLEMLKGYNRVTIEDGTITITAYTGAVWGGDET